MARTIGRLTAQQVEFASLEPGLHGDGSNLYLRVGKDGARSWAFVYRFAAVANAKPASAKRAKAAFHLRPPAARPLRAGRCSTKGRRSIR
jgi:hypothetical protein